MKAQFYFLFMIPFFTLKLKNRAGANPNCITNDSILKEKMNFKLKML